MTDGILVILITCSHDWTKSLDQGDTPPCGSPQGWLHHGGMTAARWKNRWGNPGWWPWPRENRRSRNSLGGTQGPHHFWTRPTGTKWRDFFFQRLVVLVWWLPYVIYGWKVNKPLFHSSMKACSFLCVISTCTRLVITSKLATWWVK